MVNREIGRVAGYAAIILSLVALAVLIEGILEFDLPPSPRPGDEGWQAHIWQLAMVLQLPLILLFVATGRHSLGRILPILSLLLSAWTVNFAGVYLLNF
jgi:hypothetical protein